MDLKMRYARRTALATLLLCLMPAVAHAEFPYSGYFSSSRVRLLPQDVAAQCMLKFFIQKDNGDAEDYFLDVKTFEEKGQLLFLRSNDTKCTYAPERQSEDCTTTQSATDRTETYSFNNYLQLNTPDYLETVYFRNKDEYDRFMNSDRKFDQALYPTSSFIYYHRCHDLSESSLKTYLRSVNTVDFEETDKMLSPILDGLDGLRPIAEKAARILKPAY
jgi:hypothetical protein